MQAKRKICFGCNSEQFIWSSILGKKYCQRCYYQRKPLLPVKKQQIRINKFSTKKIEDLKRYRLLRDKFLKDNPICMFPGCNSRDNLDLHHKKGRSGSFLTNKRYFSVLCRYHHEWCHSHDEEARSLGLLLSRIEK